MPFVALNAKPGEGRTSLTKGRAGSEGLHMNDHKIGRKVLLALLLPDFGSFWHRAPRCSPGEQLAEFSCKQDGERRICILASDWIALCGLFGFDRRKPIKTKASVATR